jgi:hypothetical protein
LVVWLSLASRYYKLLWYLNSIVDLFIIFIY